MTFVVPRGQFGWIRANLADQLHISPQLSTYYYGFNLRRGSLQGPAEAAPRAVAGDRSREARTALVLRVGELPAYGWVPPGVDHYHSQSFDYRGLSRWQGVSPRRSACTTRVRLLDARSRSPSSCATTPVRCTPSSRWRSRRCGRKRWESRSASPQVEFKSLLQDIDRGDMEMFRSSWVGDYNDAYSFLQVLKSDSGVNLPHYSNPRYDAMLRADVRFNAVPAGGAVPCSRRPSGRCSPITPCCRCTSTSTSTW